MSIQIFVINLARDSERLACMQERLAELCTTFVRIEAIEGALIDRAHSDIPIFQDDKYVVRYNPFVSTTQIGRLTDGELGCSLSHLKCYHKIVDENLEGALILEDDFIPQPNLIPVLESALAYCKEQGITLDVLATTYVRSIRQSFFSSKIAIPHTQYSIVRRGIPHLDWFFNRRRRIGGSYGYYISNEACRKLLDIAYPVRFESDVLLGMLAMNKLHYYSVTPDIGSFEVNNSSIGAHGGVRFV